MRSCTVRSVVVVAAVAGLGLTSAAHALLVYDSMSAFETVGPPAFTVSATGSTPNTFMGTAVNLAPGTTSITGFDLFPVNISGTTFDALRINIYVWDTVNTGTIDATHPAFSNLLASYSLVSSGTFSSGFYFPFEGSPVGTNPGITLGTPLALADPQIGIAFNYQGSTDGGATYNNVNGLTSLIAMGGAPSDNPVTVGSAVFTLGYFRNAASETDGDFLTGVRTLSATDPHTLALRVFGPEAPVVAGVPEPATAALLALAPVGLLLALHRRRAEGR